MICAPVLTLFMFAEPTNRASDVFYTEKEKTVRDAVYNNRPLSISPNMDFRSMLWVPETLVLLHKKHPQPVMRVLLQIMEGARPEDSVLAAGYANSLLDGPEVGLVCVHHFDKKTFDVYDKDWETTPRKHRISKVQSGIKKQSMK